MFEIIAVTNRLLCADEADFMRRIEQIASSGVSAIILREKDLASPDYEVLARQVKAVCDRSDTKFIAHGSVTAALNIGCERLQLPLPIFESALKMGADSLDLMDVGISVHSVEEAVRAASIGANRLIAGHVFHTDCKAGAAPRGLGFLSEVCASVDIPVYAIGGIGEENIGAVKDAGASGACLMSSFMRTEDAEAYVRRLEEGLKK